MVVSTKSLGVGARKKARDTKIAAATCGIQHGWKRYSKRLYSFVILKLQIQKVEHLVPLVFP